MKMNMSEMIIMLAMLVVLMFPAIGMAQTDVAPVDGTTGSAGWDMALTVVLPLLVAASSIIANFFEVKPTDPPAWAFVKRIINTLAINLSSKAGK